MKKFISPICVLVFFLGFALPSLSSADAIYDFVQDGTGDVLATMSLVGPGLWTAEDIDLFGFTSAGRTATGQDLYWGSLWGYSAPVIDDGAGRLIGTSPDAFAWEDSQIYPYPQLIFSPTAETPARLNAWGQSGLRMLEGEWMISSEEDQIPAVPEPATILLLGTGLLGAAGFRRKKYKK